MSGKQQQYFGRIQRTGERQNNGENMPKPFLKWAGGKKQLLEEIRRYYPFNEKITKYAEPFVGGGAVLFDILGHYDLEAVYISDENEDLINAFRVVKEEVESLIPLLKTYQEEYLPLDTEGRKQYYTNQRARFNKLKKEKDKDNRLERAALMIYLNRTCFNGLYRVNRKGLFNVPIGSYKNPLICDEMNLRLVSKKLKNVSMVCGDYKEAASFIDENTFVYFDPPYRPLTTSASFTAYNESDFNDESQKELAAFAKQMDSKGAKVLLSNSDPKNIDEEDNFFDELYAEFNIRRVAASRMINSKVSGRGKIKELLISNIEGSVNRNESYVLEEAVQEREMKIVGRDFETWFSGCRKTIANFNYFTDFKKVYQNVDDIKLSLNILNYLVGSKNIESEFEELLEKYPEVSRCIPILLAERDKEFDVIEEDDTEYLFDFEPTDKLTKDDIEQYKFFMRETGLFDLIENHVIHNLVDYATGVETGLDSNARKNRGGKLMENLVERYIQKAGFIKGKTYFKEISSVDIENKFDIALSSLFTGRKASKRFDFVIKTSTMVYAIEANFYRSQGSKLNETARSYKTLAMDAKKIDGFTFIWITDGEGWTHVKNNLEEAFNVVEHLYNIRDLENDILEQVCK